MTEAQKVLRRAREQRYRERHREELRKTSRERKRLFRKQNPEKAKLLDRKAREKARNNHPPSYIIEFENQVLEYPRKDCRNKSEYKILMEIRERIKMIVNSNIPFTIYKVKKSAFPRYSI